MAKMLHLPKVLVGCPTADVKAYCLQEYIAGLKSLTYSNFDVCIEDNSKTKEYSKKLNEHAQQWNQSRTHSNFSVISSGWTSESARERVVGGRNQLRKKALDEGYDYFFSLEQDVIPPSNALEALIERQKELVAGTYMNVLTRNDGQKNVLSVVAYVHPTPAHEKDHLVLPLGIQELFPSRLIEVAFSGLGALLIGRSTLEKTEFRIKKDKIAFDDMYFGRDNREKGILTYLDSSVLCKHLFSQSFLGLTREQF